MNFLRRLILAHDYIDQRNLANLDKYKYHGADLSLVSAHRLSSFREQNASVFFFSFYFCFETCVFARRRAVRCNVCSLKTLSRPTKIARQSCLSAVLARCSRAFAALACAQPHHIDRHIWHGCWLLCGLCPHS